MRLLLDRTGSSAISYRSFVPIVCRSGQTHPPMIPTPEINESALLAASHLYPPRSTCVRGASLASARTMLALLPTAALAWSAITPLQAQPRATLAQPRATLAQPRMALDPEQLPLLASAAVLALGGGYYAYTQQADEPGSAASVSPSAPSPPARKPPSFSSSRKKWPLRGGSGGPHPMRGPWPPPPPRELWTPPPGWKKPSKPVQSWYDRGVRLSPPAADVAASTPSTSPEAEPTWWEKLVAVFNPEDDAAPSPFGPKTWPLRGGSGGSHPMRGPWPPPPPRELWTPPPGWKKPSKPVQSWYDRGERL